MVRQRGCFWWTEKHRHGDEQKPGGFRGSSEKFRINKDHGPGRRHSWKSGVGVRLLRAKGVVHKWRARSSGSHGAGTPALCPRLILFYETQIPGAMFLYGICELNIYFVWGQSIYYSHLFGGKHIREKYTLKQISLPPPISTTYRKNTAIQKKKKKKHTHTQQNQETESYIEGSAFHCRCNKVHVYKQSQPSSTGVPPACIL